MKLEDLETRMNELRDIAKAAEDEIASLRPQIDAAYAARLLEGKTVRLDQKVGLKGIESKEGIGGVN